MEKLFIFNMRILLLGFLLFLGNLTFAQKKFEYKEHHLPVKYVLKKSSDTVHTRILAQWAFKKNYFYPTTIINKLSFVDSIGKKTNIKDAEIDFIEITDFDGSKKKFVNSERFPVLKSKKDLLLVLFEGVKTGYYVDFFIANIYGNVNAVEYIINGNNAISSNLFSGRDKKLKELFAKHPDLIAKIDELKTREDMIHLLEEYDKK